MGGCRIYGDICDCKTLQPLSDQLKVVAAVPASVDSGNIRPDVNGFGIRWVYRNGRESSTAAIACRMPRQADVFRTCAA
jgi:hypothetical protein